MSEVIEITPENPNQLSASTESVKAGPHVGPRQGL